MRANHNFFCTWLAWMNTVFSGTAHFYFIYLFIIKYLLIYLFIYIYICGGVCQP